MFHLALFLDLRMYAAYISFQLAKGNGLACLSQQLANARKVCGFLRRNADQGRRAAIDGVVLWMERVSKQLGKVMPQAKQDIGVMEASGQWMSADGVCTILEDLRVEALDEMPEDWHAPLSEYAARLLHDAALGNAMFGHTPPPRLSCLRTMQVSNLGSVCIY